MRSGFTPIAIALAGHVLVLTPKRVGMAFDAQRLFATIECGKWIDAAHSGLPWYGGGIERGPRAPPHASQRGRVNEDAVAAGWMLIVRASRDAWRDRLVTGSQVAPAFAADAHKDERRDDMKHGARHEPPAAVTAIKRGAVMCPVDVKLVGTHYKMSSVLTLKPFGAMGLKTGDRVNASPMPATSPGPRTEPQP